MEQRFPKKNRQAEGEHRKVSWLLPALGILVVVVVLSTWWLLQSARTTTGKAVQDLSRLYLEELTLQQTSQFAEALDDQAQLLRTTVHSFQEQSPGDPETLAAFVGRMKEVSSADFLGLVDSRGMVYTESGIFQKSPEFRVPEEDHGVPAISFLQGLGRGNLVLVTIPAQGDLPDGQRLTAVVMGLYADTMARQLSLSETRGRSFSNVVMPDGSYVIRTRHTHLREDSNVFEALQKDAWFADGYSLEGWQQDLEAGRPGMASYELQGLMHYTYYMPIAGTDWFIMTTMHYDLISGSVSVIQSTLTRNSMVQLALVLLVLSALFLVYLLMQKRNESLHLEKIQAEEGNKAKSLFLSNMSHDIRTPMNAIIGFTHLAVKNVEDTGKVRDYLEKILASSNHLLALINDVLDMSRIESGKIHIEETRCNIPEMLRELYEIMHGQMEEKHLEFVTDTSGVVHEQVYCDRLRMNQVFLNLLGNAVKFTPEGGRVSVVVEQEREAPEGFGAYVIRVRDTGIGMTPEFAKKVFQPFERERSSTVSGIQGTGLGMSITRNIVNLMHGTIDVVTAPGRGTEFIIRVALRLVKEQEPAGVNPQKEHKTGDGDFTGKKVLVVEDNELNREIALEILMEAGFQVDEAEDGSVALEKLCSLGPGAYDLVLMDIQMPVMDGYQATRMIRGLDDRRLAEVPIIAMTANAFDEDRKAALEAGMNGHLAKPLDVGKMFSVLEEILCSGEN